MKTFLSLVLVLGFVSACAKAPPTLSPTAQRAFNQTRVIGALDILRDTAVAAEAAQPPQMTTATARKVVTAHQSALRVMDAAGAGWQAAIATSLDELLSNVSASERAILAPYIALAKTVLNAVTP